MKSTTSIFSILLPWLIGRREQSKIVYRPLVLGDGRYILTSDSIELGSESDENGSERFVLRCKAFMISLELR